MAAQDIAKDEESGPSEATRSTVIHFVNVLVFCQDEKQTYQVWDTVENQKASSALRCTFLPCVDLADQSENQEHRALSEAAPRLRALRRPGMIRAASPEAE